MNRIIPATMISQHPDHASKPYWHHKEFIGTHHEARECFLSFSELGSTEYKWDWEGKLVDESVVERLLMEHFDYFQQHPLGVDKFLTFRLPNPNVQSEYRLGRAFMGLLSASGLAHGIGLHSPPMFEVILPMTESASDMIAIQEAFTEIATLKHQLNSTKNGHLKHIEVIPLFEEVNTMIHSAEILFEYIKLHQQQFGFTPQYLRPYLARSDPALNAGIVPTIISIKIALSRYQDFESKTGIQIYPIIGSASLPFRGGLTPRSVSEFVSEYQGVKTALLQSAFRYDYPKTHVKKAIQLLTASLPQTIASHVNKMDEAKLTSIITQFQSTYQHTIEPLAPIINHLASSLPKRRERVQHIGLFGYSRGVGQVKMPRAIGFTAALYSLGVPPELIGTGRGLHLAQKQGRLQLIEAHYKNLRRDLVTSGNFLNKSNLLELSKTESAWHDIIEDVTYIESYLGHELGPQTTSHQQHQRVTQKIYQQLQDEKDFQPELIKAAVLRKSLG
jgi:phosphoenolpyruvate carboxylase